MPSNRIEVTLEGGEELAAALRALDGGVKRVLRAAMLAAAEPVVDTGNARAPGPHIDAEVLSASEGRVTVAVGPDKAHWYYQFLERGVAAHEISGSPMLAFDGREAMIRTASVSHPGMAARPFLRPAFDEKLKAAEDAASAVLRAAVMAVHD